MFAGFLRGRVLGIGLGRGLISWAGAMSLVIRLGVARIVIGRGFLKKHHKATRRKIKGKNLYCGA